MIVKLPTAAIVKLPTDLPVEAIGGKARGLSALLAAGFRVPSALVLRADLFDGPIHRERLEGLLSGELEKLGPGPFAVRSSGVDEDHSSASQAGIFETKLSCVGLEAVVTAVLECAASVHSPRAAAYREKHRLGPPRVAIVIQQQVSARAAGVAFSCDPVQRRRDRVVVEAVRGLGDRLVSGQASPDRFVFDSDLVVVGRQLEDVSLVLSDDEAIEVARTTSRISRSLGVPIDVEWAFDQELLWILQARPVTTPLDGESALEGPQPIPRIVWTNTNAKEILPNVAKPMVFSVVKRYVDNLLGSVLVPFGLRTSDLEVLGLVGGRVYFNINAVIGWLRSFPFGHRIAPTSFASHLGGDQAELAAALEGLRPSDLPQRGKVNVFRALFGTMTILVSMIRYNSADGSGAIERMRESTDEEARAELSPRSDREVLATIDRVTTTPFGPSENAEGLAAAMVGMVSQGVLPELCRRFFGDATLAGRLLQGMGGLDSADAGIAFMRVADIAREDGLVEDLGGTWVEAHARLAADSRAARFLSAFDQLMRAHGHHCRAECDVSVARWSERPDYVLGQLRTLSHSPSQVTDAAARQAARRRLLDELAKRAGLVRGVILRAVAKRAANGARTRETAKSEAMRRVAVGRRALLEVGRRLTERGVLDGPEDVFFLTLDELPDLFGPGDDGSRRGVVRGLIAARRAEVARFESMEPPSVVVGTWVASSSGSAVATADGPIQGLAASPGVAEGLARVVLHLDDESAVRAGEILIAPFTDPGWTPYFLLARAVVTDFGGILSHGSVVAREYGLPAVVNAKSATGRIRTGDRVRVDGSNGRVEILERASG